MHPTPDIRHAPIDLWRIMRLFICTYFNLFGEPGDIAKQEVLTAKAYKLALDWLRAGEAFLRHLLLIEAANYPAPATSPRAPRSRQRRLVIFDPDKPDEWRVSFRCFSDAGDVALRQAQGDAEGRRSPPSNASQAPQQEGVTLSLSKGDALAPRFHQAWPLALRVEAMLRVYNNPGPFAQRLARKLRAKPQLARKLTHIPDNANNLVGYDAFEQAQPLTTEAQKRFEPG